MMDTKKDIETIADIKLLVNSFYEQVRKDTLLAPVFNSVIKDWEPHLEKMYAFWQTILLEEHTYNGRPFPPHAVLPIGAEHFAKWVALFTQVVDTHFAGAKADEARWRAEKMAELFQHKLSMVRQHPSFKPLI